MPPGAAMNRPPYVVAAWLVCLLPLPAVAQPDPKYAPPKGFEPEPAVLKTIQQKTTELGQALTALRSQGVSDVLIADVEIYYNGAVNIVRHKEFYGKDSAAWTLE